MQGNQTPFLSKDIKKKALESRAFFCWIGNLPPEILESFYKVEVVYNSKKQSDVLDLSLISIDQIAAEISKFRLSHPQVVFVISEWELHQIPREKLLGFIKVLPRVLFYSLNDLAKNRDFLQEVLQLKIKPRFFAFLNCDFAKEYSKGDVFELGSNIEVNEWLEYVQYQLNPPSSKIKLYKLFQLLLIILPLFLAFYLIPKESGVAFSDPHQEIVNSTENVDSCAWRGEAKPYQVRRIYQNLLFQNQIYMPREAELQKLLAEYGVEYVAYRDSFPDQATDSIIHQQNMQEGTKEWCLMLPSINELYSEDDFKIWKKWLSLIGDTLSYPTDHYWDGAETLHRKHTGIDLAGRPGSLVFSPMTGRIKQIEGGHGGRMLVVEKDSLLVYLAHLDHYLVFSGDSVKAGEPIASIGLTGRTTGPHLHLATARMHKGEKIWENPIEWMKKYEAKLER